VTDLTPYLIDSAEVFLDNREAGIHRYESYSFDPAVETTITLPPGADWYFADPSMGIQHAASIGVFYSSAGLGYFFESEYNGYLYPSGVPSLILPVPAHEWHLVSTGQQYNPPAGHHGLDFGFTDWPPTSGDYTLHEIVAPHDGIVIELHRHEIPGSGNEAISMIIKYNNDWTTLIAFEPDSEDLRIVDTQEAELTVSVGQAVFAGDVVGRLVVSGPPPLGDFGPHIHWGLNDRTTVPESEPVCPRTYCTADEADALDTLYSDLGISPVCAVLP
jgi:murein DD-endopeptidase MepM/ murein hydrolase activator NlpD